MIGRAAFLLSLFAGVAAPATAQEATLARPAVEDGAMEDEEDIVVTGARERGAVIGDIRPEVQLTPADIRSYGVSSIAELLTELEPQTGSGRGRGEGRPVVLLNGLRTSGFSEIRDIPTEAITRVDILPEEVALKYGFAANQKVVNFVLRRRFRATTVELSDRIASDGGANQAELELDLLRINPAGRFSLSGEYTDTGRLLESGRDVALDTGFDQRPFRTLVPANDQASVNAVYATAIAQGVSATVNGLVERNDSRSLLGLSADGTGPLITQNNDALTTRLATTLNGAVAGWQWTFTGAYDRVETDTETSVTADRAKSISDIIGGDFTVNGQPLTLPAGPVSATLRLNASFSDFQSRSTRGGQPRTSDIARDIGGGQLNLDVPVVARDEGALGFLGNLSVNGNAEVQRFSDFGTLTSYGAGATWSPFRALNLIASVTDEEGAPTAQQLGNPVFATPGVRVFDLVRNQSAIVTQLTGGNPGLLADDRRVFKLGMTLRPFTDTDLSLIANYTSSRTRNATGSLSFPTADIQAAFPERFLRDAQGNLILIDARPVNFARERREQLRWGVNFSKRISDSTGEQFRALAAAGRIPGRGSGAEGGARGERREPRADGDRPRGEGRGGFGGRGGGFGGGGGRLQLALYHTWHFTNDVLIRDGLPSIDLLDGGSLGRGGGQPRHELEAQAGITRNGLGARLSANWRSGTTVDGVTPTDDLRFGDLTTVNFRLFANLGNIPKLVVDNPWLRGVRVTASVDNLFNARQRVTDATGTIPINYQPDLLDPLGRTVRLTVRKLFFTRPIRGGGGGARGPTPDAD